MLTDLQWFTGETITRLTPKPNDVEFDVHESDCGPSKLLPSISLFPGCALTSASFPDTGTDPKDLNGSDLTPTASATVAAAAAT